MATGSPAWIRRWTALPEAALTCRIRHDRMQLVSDPVLKLSITGNEGGDNRCARPRLGQGDQLPRCGFCESLESLPYFIELLMSLLSPFEWFKGTQGDQGTHIFCTGGFDSLALRLHQLSKSNVCCGKPHHHLPVTRCFFERMRKSAFALLSVGTLINSALAASRISSWGFGTVARNSWRKAFASSRALER